MRRPLLTPLLRQHMRHSSTHNEQWLAAQKSRLGRLILHGTTTNEAHEAGAILSDLAHNWRQYVGAEGYLVCPQQRGLYRHAVAWGDMDSMSRGEIAHVNNVTYMRWAECARINWAWNLAKHVDPANHRKWSELWTPRGLGLILRSIKVDYKFPMEYPDKVSVYHRLSDVKDDHFILNAIILSERHQRVAARCCEDIVVYNYKPADPAQKPGKALIPEFMERVFRDTLRKQSEASAIARDAMKGIDDRIDALESQVLAREEM